MVTRKGAQNRKTDEPDAILKVHGKLFSVFYTFGRGIKRSIIRRWLSDFETTYFNSLKKLDANQTDAEKVVTCIINRIKTHDFKNPTLIVIRYSPADKFNISATRTAEEIEYEEFLKWKQSKKK
jgi:hypothetical protein